MTTLAARLLVRLGEEAHRWDELADWLENWDELADWLEKRRVWAAANTCRQNGAALEDFVRSLPAAADEVDAELLRDREQLREALRALAHVLADTPARRLGARPASAADRLGAAEQWLRNVAGVAGTPDVEEILARETMPAVGAPAEQPSPEDAELGGRR